MKGHDFCLGYSLDARRGQRADNGEQDFSDEEFESIMETKVTLCLAAACQENGKPRIVFCSDWKAGSVLGSSQTSDKLRWIKKNPLWLAMTSGTENAIESLVRHYRKSLRNVNDFTGDEIELLFADIAKAQLLKRKSDCVERELGVNYEYFRTHRDEWPQQVQSEMFTKVRKTDLAASLLIVGWIPSRHGYPKPMICKIATDSSTAICPHFGAIGEGRYVATPPLLRREFDSNVSMKTAIYELYEAKTLAEIVPSVGDDTSVDVFYPDGTLQSLTQRGYEYLNRQLKVYGPKPKVTKLSRFTDALLEPFSLSGLS